MTHTHTHKAQSPTLALAHTQCTLLNTGASSGQTEGSYYNCQPLFKLVMNTWPNVKAKALLKVETGPPPLPLSLSLLPSPPSSPTSPPLGLVKHSRHLGASRWHFQWKFNEFAANQTLILYNYPQSRIEIGIRFVERRTNGS